MQIHQVQYVAEYYYEFGTLLSSCMKHKLAEVLLAASYFLDIDWKFKALHIVDVVMAGEPTDYVQIWAHERRSTLAGMQIGCAPKEIAICSMGCADAKSKAHNGQLILSYVTNSIRRNNLDHARALLDQIAFSNFDYLSTMERLVLKKSLIARGKIQRYQGEFEQARQYLEAAVNCDIVTAVNGRSLACHLAGVLCELNDAQRAQILLRDEIKLLSSFGLQNIPSGRRLRISLAETFLLQRHLDEADNMFCELVVQNCPNPSIEKVRLCIGLARISHLRGLWPKALENWQKVLRASENCNWEAGFLEMVVWYSISHVHFALCEPEISGSYRMKADEFYAREGRQYWFTGLGTHWLDYIWNKLGHRPDTHT